MEIIHASLTGSSAFFVVAEALSTKELFTESSSSSLGEMMDKAVVGENVWAYSLKLLLYLPLQ